MVSFPGGKVHNAYIIETYNYQNTKSDIKNFAMMNGFDERMVSADSHPDIYFLEEPDKKIPIDTIRNDVINGASFSPKIADRKFFIIYDAVNLDVNTQNAMLKTLEEPLDFVTFFLVTSNTGKLLETVKSRCQIIKDLEDKDYKKVLSFDYIKDALFILSNIKNARASEIISFAENFDSRDDRLKELIMLYRYVIRDAMLYKKTLSKQMINLQEKESEIIDIANALSFEELGKLSDNLDKLSEIVGLAVNKKIAVYNFFNLDTIER